MMDLFEKKIRELYQEKRKLDEKSFPHFSVFLNKPEMKKPVRRLRMLYIRVASVAAIIIPVIFFLYYLYNSNKTGQQVLEISPVKINQPLPSQSLLNSVQDASYIWQWKAPTDRLLQDVDQSLNIRKYKKI